MARSRGGRARDKQVVEPVLWMVVVRAPALAKRRVGTAPVPVIEESLAVHLHAGDRDSEVLLPLSHEVGADRLVERIRVVGVGEALGLRSIGVPRLVLGFRRRRGESRVRVDTIAEVALQALADQPTPGADASRLLVPARI